ncbi:MAG: hypothetical protein Fur0042_14100 [Cyanophyceae cyanobacterium]
MAAVQELRLKPALAVWGGFAVITAVLALWGAVRWAAAHPHGGLDADESRYVNIVLRDLYRWHHEGLLSWVRGFISADPQRPPAYRLMGAPFVIASDGEPFWLRFSSILGFAIAVALLGMTAWQLVRRAAGSTATSAAVTVAATVAIAAIMPGLLRPIRYFYTESPLFLGTALVMLGLFWGWGDRDRRSRWAWVVWGAGLGLGLLSKVNFVVVAGGMMAVAFVVIWQRWVAGPSLGEFVAASTLGSAIAAPWWLYNWRLALGYTQLASANAPHNIGPPGAPITVMRWLIVTTQFSLGLGVSALAIAIALALLGRRTLFLPWVFPQGRSPQFWAVAICLTGTGLLCLAALVGTNHNPRLISPAWLPLIVAIAVAFNHLGWTHRLRPAAIAIVPLTVQAIVIFEPLFHRANHQQRPAWAQLRPINTPALRPLSYFQLHSVLIPQVQWNWQPLMELAHSRGYRRPTIAYFMRRQQLVPPAIKYPWRRALDTEPLVNQLVPYGSDLNAIDWETLIEEATHYDVVIALDWPNPNPRDRAPAQLNREFMRRFAAQPGYGAPIILPTSDRPLPRAPRLAVFIKSRPGS